MMCGLFVGSMAVVLSTGSVGIAAPPPDDPPPASLPADVPPPSVVLSSDSLIPIPSGCPVPEPAAVVFTGTMIGKDDVTRTIRFTVDQVRAGSADAWAINGLIDVRYGPGYRFLETGEQYLIGAGLDPTFGVLASTVQPAEPTFGGNDVVGVDDLAVDCPTLDDPIRTLHVDGTSVDSGVLSLMTADRRLLLATVAVPAAIVFAVLVGLVLAKMFGGLAFRGIFQLARAAVTPVPDHRAIRVRTHRIPGPDDVGSDDGHSSGEASPHDEAPSPHDADTATDERESLSNS